MCVDELDYKTISHGSSLSCLSYHKRASLTGVPTLLDALSPVRDASRRVSWVDDVTLVACGAVERLVSVLSCTAGLSCGTE